MKTILLQLLLLFTNILFISGASIADDWKYFGYATLDNGDTFYVFLDNAGNEGPDNRLLLRERHVFDNQQVIGNKMLYMSSVTERVLDCGNRKIENRETVLFDSNGSEVTKFTHTGSAGYEIVTDNRSIDYSLFKELCNGR